MNMPLFIFHLFQQSWFHRQKMEKKKKIQLKLFVLSDFWECRHASVGCTSGKEVYLFMHVCVCICAHAPAQEIEISVVFLGHGDNGAPLLA